MSSTEWADAVEALTPFMFRIETPSGQGTGFFLTHTGGGKIGIATALHVIDESFEWDGPIRIQHYQTGVAQIFGPNDRKIKAFPENDLAFIEIPTKGFTLPSGPLGMVSKGDAIRQGIQIGWCGFPSVAPSDLCFFNGHISARLQDSKSYLVDGVAINGVSGGPAFVRSNSTYPVDVCGVVTAYIPNRATGETLPGVCWIQDVSSYEEDYIPF